MIWIKASKKKQDVTHPDCSEHVQDDFMYDDWTGFHPVVQQVVKVVEVKSSSSPSEKHPVNNCRLVCEDSVPKVKLFLSVRSEETCFTFSVTCTSWGHHYLWCLSWINVNSRSCTSIKHCKQQLLLQNSATVSCKRNRQKTGSGCSSERTGGPTGSSREQKEGSYRKSCYRHWEFSCTAHRHVHECSWVYDYMR